MLLPTVAISAIATWLLYPVGRGIALLACPASLRISETTTDLSQADYSGTSEMCSASWFPVADGSAMAAAIVMSVLVAGFVGHRLAPSHKRFSAALSSCAVVAILVGAFAYES